MDRDINDIGRPKTRSSRPTPPVEEQRRWREKNEGRNEGQIPRNEKEKETRH